MTLKRKHIRIRAVGGRESGFEMYLLVKVGAVHEHAELGSSHKTVLGNHLSYLVQARNRLNALFDEVDLFVDRGRGRERTHVVLLLSSDQRVFDAASRVDRHLHVLVVVQKSGLEVLDVGRVDASSFDAVQQDVLSYEAPGR